LSEVKLKEITHTWASGAGGRSISMLIPKTIARKHGMDKPASVIVEETDDGILVRKVDLGDL